MEVPTRLNTIRFMATIEFPALTCHTCGKPITVLAAAFDHLSDLEELQASPYGLDICVNCTRKALLRMTILRHGDPCGREPISKITDPEGHVYRMDDYIHTNETERETA